MPTYTLKAPDGRTYSVTGPANASDKDIQAEVMRQHPGAGSAPTIAGAPSGNEPGAVSSFGAGLASGVGSVSNTLVKGAAMLVDRFGITPASAVRWAAEHISGYSPAEAIKISNNLSSLPNFKSIITAGAQNNQDTNAPYKEAHPNYFATGKVGGQIFATAPLAGLTGGAIRTAVGGTRAGAIAADALASGGFKTGILPTRAAIAAGEAAPTLSARAVDLGVRGAAGATVGAGTSVATGEDPATGAFIGAVMPTAGSMVFRTAMDKVVLPLYTRMVGQLGAQRAAAVFRSALGMSVQDAKDIAAKMPEGMTFGEGLVRAGKSEPTVQALQKTAAEGAGQDIYAPMATAQTAKDQAVLNAARGGNTAGEAEHALLLRQKQASGAYEPAYEAARQGANAGTLETAPIISNIQSKAMAEGITPTQRQAMLAVAKDIETLGPVARAGDLDAIYREGGVEAQKIFQSTNATGLAKQTGVLLSSIQPDIAGAIESAGGTGYSAAKTGYGAAQAEIGRQRFAGELSDIYGSGAQGPTKFADVMGSKAGGDTSIVSNAFPRGGKENFDVNAMLGPQGGVGPSRLPGLQEVAEGVNVRNTMATQAEQGGYAAKSLLSNPPSPTDAFSIGSALKTPAKLLTGYTVGPLAGLAMHLGDLMNSGMLNKQTQQALAEGLSSGKSAEELLSLIPLADRYQLGRRMAPNIFNSGKTSVGVNSFNMLNTPPQQNNDAGY